MTTPPDNVDLQWIGRQIVALRDDMAALRRDVDMMTRIVLRLDSTVDALREDIKSLWLSQVDLRRRLETLESK
jgi:hypothetical protein